MQKEYRVCVTAMNADGEETVFDISTRTDISITSDLDLFVEGRQALRDALQTMERISIIKEPQNESAEQMREADCEGARSSAC